MTDALRDPESGLLNDDYFRATLPNRVATARRVLRPLSIAVLDLDRRDIPTEMAYAISETLRESDTACRLRDGSFVLLLEDTAEDGAVWTVQRLRTLLGAHGVAATLWAGVAAYPSHALDADELLTHALAALEVAREWIDGRIEVAAPGA